MCHAVGLLGCLEQHFRARPIDPFQRVDREARLRIAMIERHGELLRTVGAAPLAEQFADCHGGLAVRRGRNPRLAAFAGNRKIVRQDQAEATPHRADFVLAVGVERGIAQLVPRRRAREGDHLPLAGVENDQFAPFMHSGQDDGQGGHHPIELLAVAVCLEEAALFVQKQLVKFGRELLAFQPQRLPHILHDCGDQIVPFGVGQPKLVRLERPRAPHRGVDHGFRPLAERRLAAELDQLAGLGLRQRQADLAQPPHFQSRQRQGTIAPCAESPRTIDADQRFEQFVVNARFLLRLCHEDAFQEHRWCRNRTPRAF